jgi:P27 family predicted phage terminase small subunit
MTAKPTPLPSDPSPPAPKGLSAEAKRWWGEVVDAYDLKAHELLLLRAACQAWDTLQVATATVSKEGQTFRDSNGNIRPHPSVNIARDARIGFARLVREIGLVDEAAAPSGRPPHLNSGKIRHFHGHS